MPKIKRTAYEDEQYEMKNFHYDVLENAFQNLRLELLNNHGWNRLVQDANGLTMRKVGNDKIELTYHKIETGTPDVVIRMEEGAYKFIDDVAKGLKSHYKKLSKKPLTLKKIREDKDVEQYSRLYAESAPLYGGNVYGHAIGRYLVKFRRVYEVDSKIMPDPE